MPPRRPPSAGLTAIARGARRLGKVKLLASHAPLWSAAARQSHAPPRPGPYACNRRRERDTPRGSSGPHGLRAGAFARLVKPPAEEMRGADHDEGPTYACAWAQSER